MLLSRYGIIGDAIGPSVIFTHIRVLPVDR